MNDASPAMRERRLRALGIQPLRLRRPASIGAVASVESAPSRLPTTRDAPPAVAAVPTERPAGAAIRRLALQPDSAELRDPSINKMYQALTEAVSKAGLQPVRVCDVAEDPAAAVMVFGAARLPEGVPMLRVLRADPLSVLHADRDRKRLLWERLQALGRGGGE